ncbi:MAG: hypothetical protein M3P93_07540 [Actinomycetota bacterium]|nr:hypothetical protein [Actinomycetota bacterium]
MTSASTSGATCRATTSICSLMVAAPRRKIGVSSPCRSMTRAALPVVLATVT